MGQRQRLQPLDEASQDSVGVHALMGHAGVHRPAPHPHNDLHPPSVASRQMIAAGLADDGAVGAHRLYQFLRAQPADFFLHHGGHVQVAGGTDVLAGQRADGVDHGCQRAFHVSRATSPQPPIVDRAAKRRIGPVFWVAGVHVVHVAVEHHRAARSLAAQQPDDVAPVVNPHLVVAQAFHLGADQRGDVALLAGEAGGLDEPLAEGEHFSPVAVGESR